MHDGGKKGAVVLFNLGGPDGPDAVRPFLFNLFSDPAIIGLPNPLRWFLARMIAKRRTPEATAIYAEMGGRSPLLPLTEDQAGALETNLNASDGATQWKTFVAMRYWHPLAPEVARQVLEFNPDEIVLLPLYPQFSTTTTGSSITDWMAAARKIGLAAPTRAICCYPEEAGFIDAVADLGARALGDAQDKTKAVRVLFSAHGLPKKVIGAGDPYQAQVEKTAHAVVAKMKEGGAVFSDWRVCYQSRVGPLEWIGPATDDEIKRAGADGVGLVVVPIAFVSEHSETLVELDIEYGALARGAGVGVYNRVPAVATHPRFIEGLSRLVLDQGGGQGGVRPGEAGRADGVRACENFSKCLFGKALG